MKIQIGLLGGQGRMGKWVSKLMESEFGETAILATQPKRGEDTQQLLKTDTIIDFSSPAALTALIESQLSGRPTFLCSRKYGWK